MNTPTVRKHMLYCPKCKREYKEGGQRFCNNDGGRLLPSGNAVKGRSGQQIGVFSSLLGLQPVRLEKDEKIGPPSVEKRTPNSLRRFEPKGGSTMFKTEGLSSPDQSRQNKVKQDRLPKLPESAENESEASRIDSVPLELPPIEIEIPRSDDLISTNKTATSKNKDKTVKPIPRLIDSNRIASGRADLGDRAVNPAGRKAVTEKHPNALIGQLIKGRYRVVKLIGKDQSSIAYLAEDSIVKAKNVVVRVLIKSFSKGSLEDKIVLEERISLSHVDHPNVAKVVDSGELPEGKAFIVTSELQESSLQDLLESKSTPNSMRIARIVQQSSFALSEVHQNGILHRDLKPKDILLTVSESGLEQVKVTGFCVSDGSANKENLRYKAPERLKGKLPTFAGDSYALAVIAFRLMSGKYPFSGNSPKEVFSVQKSGLTHLPSELNPKLPECVDAIFARALSFQASQRFPKARDFGDLLFNSLDSAPLDKRDLDIPDNTIPISGNDEPGSPEKVPQQFKDDSVDSTGIDSIIVQPEGFGLKLSEARDPQEGLIESTTANKDTFEEPATNETLWQNRYSEGTKENKSSLAILSFVGLLVLVFSVIGIWGYFFRNSETPAESISSLSEKTLVDNQGVDDSDSENLKLPESNIETPPPARRLSAPPNSIYYENSKTSLRGDLASKFRGFSLFYPNSWKRKLVDKSGQRVDDKFLDIAISDKEGIPIEHFMVSPYDSNGTFSSDTVLFPKLVEKSNKDISKSLEGADYRVVAEGPTTIQNGRWKAYEVNFELLGEVDGNPFAIWGRRLWIPVQRPGVKTGFILTLLATSLSEDVKGADDVGKKGDLKQIVQTFEPLQDY